MRRLEVPRYLHGVEDRGGCVTLLNERSGQWHLLNPTAAYMWRLVRDEVGEAEVIAALAARFPDVPRSRIHRDFEVLLDDLSLRGLVLVKTVVVKTALVKTVVDVDSGAGAGEAVGATGAVGAGAAVGAGGAGSAFGGFWSETAMAFSSRPPGGVGIKPLAAAALAFPVALVLTRVPFRWTARLLRFLKRRLPRSEASVAEADALATATRLVARGHPGRLACYEHSLTILLAALLSGRSVSLHLGTATDPRRFHAWVETHGQVVPLYPDPAPREVYQRVIAL